MTAKAKDWKKKNMKINKKVKKDYLGAVAKSYLSTEEQEATR
jgi:hypothetical protein